MAVNKRIERLSLRSKRNVLTFAPIHHIIKAECNSKKLSALKENAAANVFLLFERRL